NDLLIKALREYYKIFPIWFRPVLMLTLAQFELWAFLMFGHAGLAILEQGWLYLIFKIYICGFTTFFERRRFLAVLFGVLLVLLVQNATGAVATATYVQAWRAVGRNTSELVKCAMNCLTEVGKIAISLFIAYVVKAPVAQMTTTATGLQVVTATTTGPIRPVPAFFAFLTAKTTKITGNDKSQVTETGLQVYGYGPDMTTDLTVVYYDMPQCQFPATYDARTTDLIVLTETGRSKETGLSVIVISMRMIPGQHWAPQRTLTVSDVASSTITTSALPLPSPLPSPLPKPMLMPMKLPEYVVVYKGFRNTPSATVQCLHVALLNLVLDMDWQFVMSLARGMHPLGGAGRGG
ncbi:hypothetical protein V1514DRAFT_337284, partial [Lipomyces japonicus]|uniref:uncharacterized protein n=1 Tax=Lipomyces japonicus TaxID=56871 RepID=UPI0034CF41FE